MWIGLQARPGVPSSKVAGSLGNTQPAAERIGHWVVVELRMTKLSEGITQCNLFWERCSKQYGTINATHEEKIKGRAKADVDSSHSGTSQSGKDRRERKRINGVLEIPMRFIFSCFIRFLLCRKPHQGPLSKDPNKSLYTRDLEAPAVAPVARQHSWNSTAVPGKLRVTNLKSKMIHIISNWKNTDCSMTTCNNIPSLLLQNRLSNADT